MYNATFQLNILPRFKFSLKGSFSNLHKKQNKENMNSLQIYVLNIFKNLLLNRLYMISVL